MVRWTVPERVTRTDRRKAYEIRLNGPDMDFLDPVSEAEESERKPLSTRIDSVEGTRIGLLDNGKPAAGPILEVIENKLRNRYSSVGFDHYALAEFNMLKDQDVLDDIQQWASDNSIDAVISAMGDCGSCTKFLAWGTEHVEKAGVPAVGLIDDGFEMDWKSNSIEKGRPLRYSKIPVRCEVTDVRRIDEELTKPAIDDILDELTRPLGERELLEGKAAD